MRLVPAGCTVVRPRDLGQPEIQHFDEPCGRHHQIRGLHVAMDHTFRVCALECVCHLTADVDDLACRHWLSEQGLRQRVALDVLHGDEADALALTDVINDRNVWMRECRRRSRLLQEARNPVRVRVEPWGQHLQGHASVESPVMGEKHFAHTATPERRDDFVRTQLRAWREGLTQTYAVYAVTSVW